MQYLSSSTVKTIIHYLSELQIEQGTQYFTCQLHSDTFCSSPLFSGKGRSFLDGFAGPFGIYPLAAVGLYASRTSLEQFLSQFLGLDWPSPSEKLHVTRAHDLWTSVTQRHRGLRGDLRSETTNQATQYSQHNVWLSLGPLTPSTVPSAGGQAHETQAFSLCSPTSQQGTLVHRGLNQTWIWELEPRSPSWQ